MAFRCCCTRRLCLCLDHTSDGSCEKLVAASGEICLACIADVPLVPSAEFRLPSFVGRVCGNGPTNTMARFPVDALSLHRSDTSEVLHRVWIDASGRGNGASFAPLFVHSLESFAGLPQVLWTMGTPPAFPSIAGLSIRPLCLDAVVDRKVMWMASLLPVPFLKDIIALRIVHAQGGWFLDLDVVSLGQPLSAVNATPRFVDEPTRPAGCAFHRKQPFLSFSSFGCPRGRPWMLALAAELQDFWWKFCLALVRLEVSAPDWGEFRVCKALVQHNQRRLTVRVIAHEGLEAILNADSFIPYAWNTSRAPSLQAFTLRVQGAVAVNLWASQWSAEVQAAVAAHAATVRNAALSSQSTNTGSSDHDHSRIAVSQSSHSDAPEAAESQFPGVCKAPLCPVSDEASVTYRRVLIRRRNARCAWVCRLLRDEPLLRVARFTFERKWKATNAPEAAYVDCLRKIDKFWSQHAR